MSVETGNPEKVTRILERDPNVTIFLRPIAAPAALGLAGFSGSTFITASYIARWWGNEESPTIFFPFVAFWGGLGQFIAGLYGYAARDTLITVIHVLWGSFWMSIGLLYLLVATGALPPHGIHEHFPELASWMVVLAFFTWSGALASSARDVILCGVLTTLAIGTTIACCLFAYGSGVRMGMKAAAYFWIISAILAWWRVTVYLVEEAFGSHPIVKFFPIFRTSAEGRRPLLAPGFGEPGVKRGMPGLT
ncbi:GPR1/FUN34/yaaH family-domain-containing protein [Aspergillus stella-maris]|uniref:GPR1/FUN34/yaaH family-domain-containing protein n=1 Tax=Aspergillus stella-maris TaxID=1810926 RepID=UPI003CCCB03E